MIVQVDQLGVRRGERSVLSGVSFALDARGRLAVLGPSGAGKTTLLRVLAGLHPPTAGEVRLDGKTASAAGATLTPPEERGVGLVFQDLALWPHKSVEATLSWVARGTKAERRETARRLAHEVGLGGRLDALPSELSGGEQQRLALARALAPEPRLLLLDEPFAHLDPPLRWELGGRLNELLAARETALVLVTHERRDALDLAEELLVLDAGAPCDQGPVAEVLAAPRHARTVELLALGSVLPAERVAPERARCALGEVELTRDDPDLGALWIRADQLQLGQGKQRARVVRRVRRLGPDGLLTPTLVLRLEAAPELELRALGEAAPGEELAVALRGPCAPLRL